jgi:hypothetical protein
VARTIVIYGKFFYDASHRIVRWGNEYIAYVGSEKIGKELAAQLNKVLQTFAQEKSRA